MKQGSDSSKYIRICLNGTTGDMTKDVWGLTYKCASTTLLKALPEPRMYTQLETGDHVRIIVRDPRDRLVSAWRWFTKHHNCYIKPILERSAQDHEYILNSSSPFKEWAETALQYWNPHWAPQTEIHSRWREFELIPITDLPKGWGHDKKTRSDNTWEQYYDDGLLALVNEVYKEDIEMWKEIEDGVDTRARRVL